MEQHKYIPIEKCKDVTSNVCENFFSLPHVKSAQASIASPTTQDAFEDEECAWHAITFSLPLFDPLNWQAVCLWGTGVSAAGHRGKYSIRRDLCQISRLLGRLFGGVCHLDGCVVCTYVVALRAMYESSQLATTFYRFSFLRVKILRVRKKSNRREDDTWLDPWMTLKQISCCALWHIY